MIKIFLFVVLASALAAFWQELTADD